MTLADYIRVNVSLATLVRVWDEKNLDEDIIHDFSLRNLKFLLMTKDNPNKYFDYNVFDREIRFVWLSRIGDKSIIEICLK